MYQLSDEYHLNYLGGGISAGIELPVALYWSILNNELHWIMQIQVQIKIFKILIFRINIRLP